MPSLAKYQKMRNFERTREPQGAAPRGKKLARPAPTTESTFVVQKHAARTLHYDFRLELDGVLLSWAVPKGPSLDPSVKRLAMEVEDHPLEYGGFEGTIPKGEYGAGTVEIWDHGTWQPEGDPRAALRKGHLKFTLRGERLSGAWHLVRTKRAAEGGSGKDGKGWLLFKSRDAAANPENDAAPAALPERLEPELATLVDRAPSGDDWLHEIKLDGYRIVARISGDTVQLLSRNGKDWTDRLPALCGALRKLKVDSAFVDGELVALDEKGVSRFQLLQNSLHDGGEARLVYYAFDLPYLNGRDLTQQPLVERKSHLRELLERHERALDGRVRFSAHIVGSGGDFFDSACKLGLEGTVAKRASSPYRAGRGRDWLKIKCVRRQEFAIVGYTEPAGSRSHLGALLLGVAEPGGLRYAGRVGTGFSESSLRELSSKLGKLEIDTPALSHPPRGADARGVHWVEPELVAEVAFSEMTSDGLLRHPTFQGLREDKRATETKLEQPTKLARQPSYPLTNPDKILYPEQGISKRQLLEYYALVAERMLPHVANRPLTLVRCPNGHDKHCFFQKHPGKGDIPGLRSISIREKEGKAPYSVLDDEQGLFGLVQLGALEIHTWGSRADDFEHPDILVFDLDPDVAVEYAAVIDAARSLRQAFAQVNLETFVKTTGGKGLHVCVPITPELGWDQIKAFTGHVAEAMARSSPELYVATQSKAKRKGKTFIDYLRNGRGATFIAPYSTRARQNAPVATPLDWDELSPKLLPSHFTVQNLPERLARLKRDPFERLAQLRQRLHPERHHS